jgi:hypothetical protein
MLAAVLRMIAAKDGISTGAVPAQTAGLTFQRDLIDLSPAQAMEMASQLESTARLANVSDLS